MISTLRYSKKEKFKIKISPENTVTTFKNFNSILVNKPKTLLAFENIGLHLNNLNLQIESSIFCELIALHILMDKIKDMVQRSTTFLD